jgi:hypothetical protein
MSKILVNPSKFGSGEVAAFGTYKSWYWHKLEGGDRSTFPEYSGKILDLKEGRPSATAFFHTHINPELSTGFVIAITPSHDPARPGVGLRSLCASLAAEGNRADGASALVRHTKIEKLAHGGDRSLEVHLNSIRVDQPQIITGRDVLLLDDVMKTGNSLIACKKLLLDAGAKSVQCAAVGRTG